MKISIPIYSLILSSLLIACGSLKVRDKDQAAVNSVKRIAVVAFATLQPGSATLGLNLSKGSVEGGSNAVMHSRSSDHAEKMYSDLADTLKKNLKWNVLDKKSMITNPDYAKAYKQTMEGWQSKTPPGRGINQFLVGDVMDADGPRILGPQGRDELIKALKVDAILVARVNTVLKGTSIMGIGNRYPKAMVSFYLYSKGKEQAIWFDGGIEGDESKTSIGKTAFIDEQLLGDLAVNSAKSAFSKIGAN